VACTLSARHLAGQKELDGGDHGVRRRPPSVEPWIEELQRAALLADGHGLAGLAHHRLEHLRLPHVRDRLRLGVTRHLARQLPQSVNLGGVHPLVKIHLDRGERVTSHGPLLRHG